MGQGFFKELLLMFGLGLVLNLIWSYEHLGFTQAQPHPYLFIVLVIGARYGIAASMITSALAVGSVYGLSHLGSDPVEASALLARPWNLVIASWVVCGALVGSMVERLKREKTAVEGRLDDLTTQFDEQKRRLELTEAENSELRIKVLGEGETLSTVYEMARRLTTLQGKELLQASLELVERYTGASHGSIYLMDPAEKQFQLAAVRGQGDELPSELPRGDSLVEKCLREGRVITIKDLFTAERSRQHVPGVLAIPLGVFEGDEPARFGVMIVYRIPLEALNAQTMSVFSLLGDWVSRSLSLVKRYQASGDVTSSGLLAQLGKRRFTSAALQTISRYAPTDELAIGILSDPNSPDIAAWNASRMLGDPGQTNQEFGRDPLREILGILLEKGSHLGAVLASLPVRPDLTGCTGLRLRVQERTEMNSHALQKVLKLFVTRFHGNLVMELYALEAESSPSRRQFHMDNLLNGIPFLEEVRDVLSHSLGIDRPVRLRTSERDLLAGLTHDPDAWTRRFAALASQELDFPVDSKVVQELSSSLEPLDQEVGKLLEG